MNRSWFVAGAFLCAVAGSAHAQRADCPKPGAPMPSRPPQLGGPAPANGVFNVEEGHVSAILHFERAAKAGPLPQQDAGIASAIEGTPLAQWNYEGYLPERVPYRVTRFFRDARGSILAFSEWDFAADVGTITMPGMNNRLVHGRPAGLFAMRSPSGCVSTTLSWKDDRKLYRLEIVGPLDPGRQRAVLVEIGEAVAR
jgi:hypothetical protein